MRDPNEGAMVSRLHVDEGVEVLTPSGKVTFLYKEREGERATIVIIANRRFKITRIKNPR